MADQDVAAAACAALEHLGDASAAPRIAARLDAWDSVARCAACRALGVLGGEDELNAICRLAFDFDATVRAAACLALGELGLPGARGHLERLTGAQPIEVETAAHQALARLGDTQSVELLLTTASRPGAERERTIAALIRAGGDHVLPGLFEALDSESLDVRQVAVEVLGRLGDPRAFGAIRELTEDDSWLVRRVAAVRLGRIGEKDEGVSTLLNMLHDPNPLVQGAAQDALMTLGEARLSHAVTQALAGQPQHLRQLDDPRALETIRGALDSEDPTIRTAACHILAEAAVGAFRADLEKCVGDDDAAVRECALRGLTRIGDPESVPVLVQALLDPVESVRDLAWRGLADAGFEAVRPLCDLLHSPEPDIRAIATTGLGHTRTGVAVPALRLRLEKDDHPGVRLAAVEALGRIESGASIDALVGALADADQYVRAEAVRILARTGDDRLVEEGLTLLADEAAGARLAGAELLGQLDATQAVEMLVTALDDPDHRVQQEADRALERLGEGALLAAAGGLLRGNPSALLSLKDQRAISLVLRRLETSEWAARAAACHVLTVMGDERAIPGLLATLADVLRQGDDTAVALVAETIATIVARQIDALCEWLEAHEAGARGHALARGGLHTLDVLAPLVAEPYVEGELREQVVRAMTALAKARESLFCGACSQPLTLTTVKVGVLARVKLVGCMRCKKLEHLQPLAI